MSGSPAAGAVLSLAIRFSRQAFRLGRGSLSSSQSGIESESAWLSGDWMIRLISSSKSAMGSVSSMSRGSVLTSTLTTVSEVSSSMMKVELPGGNDDVVDGEPEPVVPDGSASGSTPDANSIPSFSTRLSSELAGVPAAELAHAVHAIGRRRVDAVELEREAAWKRVDLVVEDEALVFREGVDRPGLAPATETNRESFVHGLPCFLFPWHRRWRRRLCRTHRIFIRVDDLQRRHRGIA